MRGNQLDADLHIRDLLTESETDCRSSCAAAASLGETLPEVQPAVPDEEAVWGEDTIVAVSTALGRGAIGIVRMSGPEALRIACACVRPAGGRALQEDSHRLTYGRVVDPRNGEALDEVLVAVMRAPRTYTREDIVEIHCHGGPAAQRAVLRLLVQTGARVAEPGEFTRRAFLNGRIDLTQAESVAAIVAARSSGALRASLRQLEGGLAERLRAARHELVSQLAAIEATVDFSDDDVDDLDWEALAGGLEAVESDLRRLLRTAFLGRALEQGVRTTIVGRPNVGKSSLLNALLMRERAIVSDIPGTTRDTIEELMEIGGIPIHLVDTAGVRVGGDHVEQLGVQRSLKAMEQADLVLAVFDLSIPWTDADARLVKRLSPARSIIVGSKKDLVERDAARTLVDSVARASHGEHWLNCSVSAVNGEGLDQLRDLITKLITGDEGVNLEEPVLATERQRSLVEQALVGTVAARGGAVRRCDEELICEDIRSAVQALGRMTGEDLTSDLLDEIFSRFCLGK
jgi:tRNA modification GTPase